MNLYLLTQSVNGGYDTHDACVVAAETEDEARQINPSGKWHDGTKNTYTSWAYSPDQVVVKLIGVAIEGTPRGEILASFNAG